MTLVCVFMRACVWIQNSRITLFSSLFFIFIVIVVVVLSVVCSFYFLLSRLYYLLNVCTHYLECTFFMKEFLTKERERKSQIKTMEKIDDADKRLIKKVFDFVHRDHLIELSLFESVIWRETGKNERGQNMTKKPRSNSSKHWHMSSFELWFCDWMNECNCVTMNFTSAFCSIRVWLFHFPSLYMYPRAFLVYFWFFFHHFISHSLIPLCVCVLLDFHFHCLFVVVLKW